MFYCSLNCSFGRLLPNFTKRKQKCFSKDLMFLFLIVCFCNDPNLFNFFPQAVSSSSTPVVHCILNKSTLKYLSNLVCILASFEYLIFCFQHFIFKICLVVLSLPYTSLEISTIKLLDKQWVTYLAYVTVIT